MSLIPFTELEIQGKKIRVSYLVGKILHTEQRTSLSVSGGHSYGNGHIAPITSRETQHSKLFLQTGSDREQEVNLTNADVGFRPDQWVTLLAIEGEQGWNYVGALNHSTLARAIWRPKIEGVHPGSRTLQVGGAMLCLLLTPCTTLAANATSSDSWMVVTAALMIVAILLFGARSMWSSSVTALETQLQGILDSMQKHIRNGGWRPPF